MHFSGVWTRPGSLGRGQSPSWLAIGESPRMPGDGHEEDGEEGRHTGRKMSLRTQFGHLGQGVTYDDIQLPVVDKNLHHFLIKE